MRLPRLPPRSGERPFDVVALGENSLDLIATLPAGPALVPGKRRLKSLTFLPGGQAATLAVGCARLGLRARYVGCVGDDRGADEALSGLKADGVDVAVRRLPGVSSRTAVILVDADGNRDVLEARDERLALAADDWLRDRAVSGRVLMVDATDLPASLAAVRAARTEGIPTLVDVDTTAPAVEHLLRTVDVVVVSESVAEAYGGAGQVGAGLRRLSREGAAKVVVATLGARGSIALVHGQECRTAGYVVDVVDTTGAGDAFRAGLIGAWLRLDTDTPVDTLLKYANATGALNCRALGAQTALPTVAEVEALVTRDARDQSK